MRRKNKTRSRIIAMILVLVILGVAGVIVYNLMGDDSPKLAVVEKSNSQGDSRSDLQTDTHPTTPIDEPITPAPNDTTETRKLLADIDDWNTGVNADQYFFALEFMELVESDNSDSPYSWVTTDEGINWYHTTAATEYWIYDAADVLDPYQVDGATFLDETLNWLTERPYIQRRSVEVTISGEEILRIEWFFTPWAG